MTDFLLPYLPIEDIRGAYAKAPGNELESGKLSSPESSAALVANTFGYFLNRPNDFPPIPGLEDAGWPPHRVALEECARFPWSGGHHPWLDTMLETSTHLIGIESKRYEPFRHKNAGTFSKTYWRPVWGNNMAPFEGMRDKLAANSIAFEHLDAAQLVKHAFGLRTEGKRRGKQPVLLYLFVEPSEWPDGRSIDPRQVVKHRSEAMTFADKVKGAEVAFALCSYNQLLASFAASPVPGVREHASRVMELLRPWPGDDGAPPIARPGQ